jgi:hypothetical protein
VSVNGAEEDGVDNRVEAPAWAPGDDSEGTASAEESVSIPSPAADHTSAEAAAAAPPQPSFIPAPGTANSNSNSNSTSPANSTSPMAVVAGAANGARGLASKVGASFSGMTKTKPKPKPKPKTAPARKQPGAGLPPRPQQSVRPQGSGQPTRSAMLTLQRLEPMSVMKFSSLIALVGWVAMFVAVAIIYFALSKMGVFSKIEDTVGLVTSNKAHSGADAASWFSASRVLEYTAIVCTVNAVLFTALATVGAALYNLVTNLTGGVEVTLKESD